MNHIETIICLLLLFMTAPDICHKFGRPSLMYAVFVIFGITLGPLATTQVETMLTEAGKVGFLLLLFEVGLEIELPRLRELMPLLRFAAPWVLLQYPLLMALASIAGFNLPESLVASAALTGCSVGMAHMAWKHHPGLDDQSRRFTLQVMVILELLAILLLAVEAVALQKGLSWKIPLKLAGISLAVFLVAQFATHVSSLFQYIIEKATHWRTHLLVLLVLVVCGLGERLGLSGAKTAFVLGLFMSRTEHDHQGLQTFMSPISHRFLIPIFFVSLGMNVPWEALASLNSLLALGTAGLVLGARKVFHTRWFKLGSKPTTGLLLCPNLTVVALGAAAMIEAEKVSVEKATWLLLTGLFITVFSLFLLPPTDGEPEVHDSASHAGGSSPAHPQPADGSRA